MRSTPAGMMAQRHAGELVLLGGARQVGAMNVMPSQLQQFQGDGWCVLERVIPEHALAALDAACQQQTEQRQTLMDQAGAEILGLTHKNKRYFLPCQNPPGSAIRQFLFSEAMAGVVGSLLGGDAFLFLELFVVKPASAGMPFGWHQDSGYLMGREHEPYLTLWCAMDDMTADNGALHVLPFSRIGTRAILPHAKDKATGDLIGYQGDDPGVVLPMPRGSIAAFSSLLLHRSGPNSTAMPRRAFLAAYSRHPITDAQGRLWEQAVPFLKNGARSATGVQ